HAEIDYSHPHARQNVLLAAELALRENTNLYRAVGSLFHACRKTFHHLQNRAVRDIGKSQLEGMLRGCRKCTLDDGGCCNEPSRTGSADTQYFASIMVSHVCHLSFSFVNGWLKPWYSAQAQ